MTAAVILFVVYIWWDDLDRFFRDVHRIADHFDPPTSDDDSNDEN